MFDWLRRLFHTHEMGELESSYMSKNDKHIVTLKIEVKMCWAKFCDQFNLKGYFRTEEDKRKFVSKSMEMINDLKRLKQEKRKYK